MRRFDPRFETALATIFLAASRAGVRSRGRTTTAKRALRAAALGGALILLAGRAPAGELDFRVAPGPTVMSPEEKALAPDPSKGEEHAVILLEETIQDDSDASYPKFAYHLRAKILSSEGRSLADVLIPFNSKTGYLNQWWGRVLLPDGTSQEVPRDDLKEQTVIKAGGLEFRVLQALLPGVVPGSVIDYGWAYRGDGIDRVTRVVLQRQHPIRELRYRWLPWTYMGASYRLLRAERLSVRTEMGRGSLTILAKDLPMVPDEPLMPPDSAVRGSVTLYYRSDKTPNEEFWDAVARREEGDAKWVYEYRNGVEVIREKIAALNLPADADLHARLKAVYEWLGANVKVRSLRTAEEREEEANKEAKRAPKKFEAILTEVLREGTASSGTLARLFLGFARALGAEANIVLAADRTDHIWDKGLFSDEQLDEVVVALRRPGEPDSAAVFAAVGSGLPYGEIPWWITPTMGLLATEKGMREIVLPSSPATRNQSRSRATIQIGAGSAPAEVVWTHEASGQHGLLEMRALRRIGPDDRKKKIDEWCGAGRRFDVTRSEGPDPASPAAKFSFACEGLLLDAGFDPSQERGTMRFDGVWFEPVPELPPGPRRHPVVLDYPRVDIASVEVVAPPGFEPAGAPAPVRIETGFGRYSLLVTRSPAGYSVRRDLALQPVQVKPEAYEDFRRFLDQVRLADRTPLEFRRAVPAPPS